MTVNEAARALNLNGPEVVYRLLRVGVLRGRKVNGVWDVDEASIEERIRRVGLKRSSRSNLAAERTRRREEARAVFVEVA